MSRATKRKHVVKEVTLDNLALPTTSQEIVRVIGSRGNNLHAVENSKKEEFLASMPTKFRKNVWIKRGDFVLVEPISEGDRVKAEIVSIVTPDHIEFYKENKCWPEGFEESNKETVDCETFVNTNHIPQNNNYRHSSSDDSDEDSTSSESGTSKSEESSEDDDTAESNCSESERNSRKSSESMDSQDR